MMAQVMSSKTAKHMYSLDINWRESNRRLAPVEEESHQTYGALLVSEVSRNLVMERVSFE
jgi:hypothetical protein